MKITRFEDLECWQEARKLVSAVYGATMNGNFKKDLRLSGQIQAAATSVMANISEGFVRRSTREFIQFLFVGMSSAAEVQSHLYVALIKDTLIRIILARSMHILIAAKRPWIQKERSI